MKQHLERYVYIVPCFGFKKMGGTIWSLSNLIYFHNLFEIKKSSQQTLRRREFSFPSISERRTVSRFNKVSGRSKKFGETKVIFPYELCDSPDKLDCTKLRPYDCFFSKLRNNNPVEKVFNGVLKKLRIQSVAPKKFNNNSFLKLIWEHHKMTTLKDFIRWYNSNNVVPTLEAMQKKCSSTILKHWHVETGLQVS